MLETCYLIVTKIICCVLTSTFYYFFSLCLREMVYLKGVRESDLRNIRVVLLNGVHLDLICSVESIGRHLYDCVASYLGLVEQVFFGLVYVQG